MAKHKNSAIRADNKKHVKILIYVLIWTYRHLYQINNV